MADPLAKERPRCGVIIDGGRIARWQFDALTRIRSQFDITVYNCTNMRAARRRIRHWPYYALNLAALRTPLTRSLPASALGSDIVDFACEHDGSWQRLPGDFLERMKADGILFVTKFGMGLLRVPPDAEFSIPILSFHHGDPRRFRGRPAGFYELLSGEPVVGQVVQRLTNRLDAGEVLAFAETKARPHSYRATMEDAYRTSPLLLPQAVRTLLAGERLDMVPAEHVTTLPGPMTVARFVLQRFAALVRRLGYGLAIEKRWRVAFAADAHPQFAPLGELPRRATWTPLPLPDGYRFIADPFFHPAADGVLVEAMRSDTAVGDILHIVGENRQVVLSGRHFSYPAAIQFNGETQLVPEMSEHDDATVFRLERHLAIPIAKVGIDRGARLIDPTPFYRSGRCYLFANLADEGPSILRLWIGDDLSLDLVEHPASPICMSPAGGRMGGLIAERDGRLFRFGQDNRGRYGDGLILFAIDALTPDEYRESPISELRFEGARGPHTLNLRDNSLLFDFYDERFSPLAAIRRLRGRLAQQSSRQAHDVD